MIFGVFLGSYCNSQIHKWAHTEDPPSWVRALQRSRFFLSPEHHSKHHAGTHDSHYCITTGWLNPLLDFTGFFRHAECSWPSSACSARTESQPIESLHAHNQSHARNTQITIAR